MIALAYMDLKDLTKEVYDIIAKASIELGHRTDAKTMVLLAQSFAQDLQTNNSFKRLYFKDIAAAFYNGVRAETDQQYLSIPTMYRWVRAEKALINEDIYKVRTLNAPKEQAPRYRDLPKLLTNKTKK